MTPTAKHDVVIIDPEFESKVLHSLRQDANGETVVTEVTRKATSTRTVNEHYMMPNGHTVLSLQQYVDSLREYAAKCNADKTWGGPGNLSIKDVCPEHVLPFLPNS
jgi:hypothetical protein